VSFRREKYVPRGGPDGGDGGKGGDVVLVSTGRRRTLGHFRGKSRFRAEDGGHGSGSRKKGKDGGNCVVEVPLGTVVRERDTGRILWDLVGPEERIVARGGRGGKGNKHFATATHRAPRFAQEGEGGESRTLLFSLKLLADVGVIGLPNAGKSTLVGALSLARPKVGAYPFTTVVPVLGIVEAEDLEPFVIADMPGLIKGAHRGSGLGLRFLRHVERARVLVHLVDATGVGDGGPVEAFRTVNEELARYDEALGRKGQVVVLSKMDLPGAEEGARGFEEALGVGGVVRVSATKGWGIEELKAKLGMLVGACDAVEMIGDRDGGGVAGGCEG